MKRPSRSHCKRSVTYQRYSSIILIVLWMALPLLSFGQGTRTEEIERQRDEKAGKINYDAPGKPEKDLTWIEDTKPLDRITVGFHA